MHSTDNSATKPYIVSHNHLLAHATVVELYREKIRRRQSFCYCNDPLASTLTENKNGDPIGPQAEGNSIIYIIYPQGVKKLLEFMNKN
ncbi:beta-glucosidase 10-like [Prunus yedoensis var. nudiflora]|uniref:Beta-glucosidase 10-like n=1 Tax=Prunus yedoensis var. nudiflora TaxID=2094558 RepID=A0A314YIW3_PRUYE|nr:beta-glucosidase 10-like [Prunus yedoensis var. nudiflora]